MLQFTVYYLVNISLLLEKSHNVINMRVYMYNVM